MRPFANRGAEATEALDPREAAPARNRVRLLAIGIFAVLLLLAGRAVQLAFSGDPLAEPRRNVAVAATPRADIVDRNGELLATTVRAYVLAAEPRNVWNAAETADALRNVFPGLDRATVIRRLSDTTVNRVWLRQGLTPNQRDDVQALGLAGIVFENQNRRVYPQGQLAAHTIGFTDVDLRPLSGVERGMDEQIRVAGAEGAACGSRLMCACNMRWKKNLISPRAALARRGPGRSFSMGVRARPMRWRRGRVLIRTRRAAQARRSA
ncbi:MAG: hypothetical protein M0D54_15845 [Hyphomonadaceae bacterium JAD_PAG50586_4]|nr:MAG: hypothetical protein M0D54_15845 [Hyphomonadaceae bacterium JAD_PAG50586_4]